MYYILHIELKVSFKAFSPLILNAERWSIKVNTGFTINL